MFSDIRFALRSLAKSPGFAFVAITTLALCIGANSAIFTVVNSVLLRPLPYPDSERLVQVYNSYPKSDLENAGVSIPDFLDRMDRAPSLEDGAIYTWESLNLATEQKPSRVLGLRASPGLFSTLQTAPARGRVFSATEAQPGHEHVVVLSHALWRDNFGARDEAIGQSLRLNGVPYEIIGVMPESFSFPTDTVKLWMPFAFTPEQMGINERGREYSAMIARLKPGATAAMLTAECDAIVQQNLLHAEEFRPFVEASGFTGIAHSMLDQTVKKVRPMLWLLQAGVIAALLIGCANVANLLLTRALARQRELAIRTALGAGRWNIVRQILVESLVLFAIGGGLGLLVAMWSLTGMESLGVSDLPRGESISLDMTAFVFTFVCASLTGVAFGLIPALQASRADASEALKAAGSRGTAGIRQRALRNTFVVTEIALSLMLLATTALLVRSFHHLQQQSAGFDPESVMTARFTLPKQAYAEDSTRQALVEDLIARLNSTPGVIETAVTSNIPFGYSNSQGSYHIEDHEIPPGQPSPHGHIRSVSAGYFATMGVPLQRGRAFDATDSIDAESVVIIDRVLADRYWPGEDPVGKRLYRGAENPENLCTIIGVVGAVKHRGLDDPVRKETLYYPYPQRTVADLTLIVRTAVAPESLTAEIRQAVLAADPDLPIFDIKTLTDRVSSSLQTRRTPMLLLGLFSGMALLLAALGVYGVLAFSVSQRTQEIGIRMALGAATADVLGLILRQGLKLIGGGILCGVVGYVAISQLLRSLVYEIAPLDPLVLLVAAVILIGIATIACWLPARRAARVDPMVALRDE